MGSVGMAMSIAPAIGPTIGGLQTDINGWRSIFCSLTIIGAISVVLAVFFLHNFGEHDLNAHADFFSVGSFRLLASAGSCLDSLILKDAEFHTHYLGLL